MQRRILLADDQKESRQLRSLFEADDVTVDLVDDAKSALKALQEQNYSVLLIDLKVPGLDLKLIEDIQKRNLRVTMIILTDHGNIEQAVEAMRLGAYDFHTKPIDRQHLRLVVERVLRERRLQDEVVHLREQLQHRYSFHNIISKSPRMHSVFELICNVAQTSSTVLIEGETGTGKEKVAEAIHQASNVRTGPMIAVNCAAIPETLLESELFGHEKGAFTSAVSQRHGRFEMAHGGTIFLDEVGDIPAAMQAKLLRVLQDRRFERVGGTESIEVDVRVVAATNRSLLKLVQDNQFREDLYYRLNVVKIELPPLRDRKEDIPLLAAYFAEKYAHRRVAEEHHPQDDADAVAVSLAGEHPRAGERHRARLRDVAERRHPSGEPAAGGFERQADEDAGGPGPQSAVARAAAADERRARARIHSQGPGAIGRRGQQVRPALRPVAAQPVGEAVGVSD